MPGYVQPAVQELLTTLQTEVDLEGMPETLTPTYLASHPLVTAHHTEQFPPHIRYLSAVILC